MASATPCPPPIQRVAIPFRALRFFISWTSETRIRQPDAPIGCPSAIAPPLTLTRRGSHSSIFPTEIACAASEYPDHIKPSAVEFLLPKPSYTIDTLRYLTQNFGSEMRFSILMGGDQIARLDGWKEYERVLEYPIYVYPRRGERTDRFAGRITVLDDAPLQDLSATQIRERIGRGEAVDSLLDDGVAEYIRRKGLWSPASRIAALSARIDAGTADAALYVERGRLHFRLNEWGAALNDFNRALALDTDNAEARQYVEMAREILEFRYKDLYNP